MIDVKSTEIKTLRDYGFLMGITIAGVFGFYPWLILKKTIVMWPFIVSVALGAVALFYPRVLEPLYRGWMLIGQSLGKVNSTILLTACYWVLFVPVAFIFRCMKRDRMHRTESQQEKSFRVLREELRDVKRMEYPF